MSRYGDDRAPLDHGTGMKRKIATVCPHCGVGNGHNENCVMKECVSCHKMYNCERAEKVDHGKYAGVSLLSREHLKFREQSERLAQAHKDKCDKRGYEPDQRVFHGPKGSDGRRVE